MLATHNWALWLGPALAAAAAVACSEAGYGGDMVTVAFVAVLCVVWWVFEPVPIPVTSLVPLALLPLLGVLTPAQVGQAYGSPLILLLLGFGRPKRIRLLYALSTIKRRCSACVVWSIRRSQVLLIICIPSW